MSLQQLKSVIQAANPEIMELKFGCEYIFEKPEGSFTGWVVTTGDMNGFIDQDGDAYDSEDEHVKILGRPIRLADVLLALQNEQDNMLYVNKFGDICDYRTKLQVAEWDLANDSLDNQSPETLAFLAKLLCEN